MSSESDRLFQQACNLFPGGVNSPVRAFKSVGGNPRFIERGDGAWLIDVDGNRYVDYVLSYGPLILGHAHPEITAALNETAATGTSYGMPHQKSLRLGELIRAAMPGLEMLRFVNSGTEATMSALRLARAFTGRNKILKFEGCYHGHADFLLVQAGSGVATLGLPDSPGVTSANTADTLVAPYNDLDAVEQVVRSVGDDLAAIIVEPVAGNMGMVAPREGFLAGLKALCEQNGALLIFDEVMTGFRVGPGGAQELFGVRPDLTTLGKVIGGGLPVGAYGGRQDVMEMVAPVGAMYQAGTLSGNPMAMAAGIVTLEKLNAPGVWQGLDSAGEKLIQGVRERAARHGIPLAANRIGTMSSIYFRESTPTNWSEVSESDADRFVAFFQHLLKAGVFLAPSPYEAGFISTAHDDAAIDHTLNAMDAALESLA